MKNKKIYKRKFLLSRIKGGGLRMPKAKGNLIGAWAFLIGVVLAVILGLLGKNVVTGIWAIILVVLGIIVGLLNIGSTETKEFLLAGTALVVVGALGGQTLMGVDYLGSVLQALVILFVPATIVVALKSVFAIAKK
jgi:hypothetical protein